jgi:hypothetical protein
MARNRVSIHVIRREETEMTEPTTAEEFLVELEQLVQLATDCRVIDEVLILMPTKGTTASTAAVPLILSRSPSAAP